MPSRKQVYALLLVASLGLASLPASHADTLVIEAVRQAASIERPSRGQSMADVEARFGSPAQQLPAVGQPPITRWFYAGFTVYFVDRTVVHAVVNR